MKIFVLSIVLQGIEYGNKMKNVKIVNYISLEFIEKKKKRVQFNVFGRLVW